jgi:hypothetical protein
VSATDAVDSIRLRMAKLLVLDTSMDGEVVTLSDLILPSYSVVQYFEYTTSGVSETFYGVS